MFQYYALFLAACLGGSLNSVWLYKKYQQSAGTELSSDVVYLVINGVVSALVSAGVIVVSTLAAVLLYREKLTRNELIGLIIGAVSVVFLCL